MRNAACGRQRDVLKLRQRMIGLQRLVVEHVEAGVADVAALERAEQRGFVNQCAARVSMDDLSIRTESEPAPYAIVTVMRLVPGKVQEFSTWMKDEYMPAMKKAEVKNLWVSQTVFGGNSLERVAVRPIKSMSEIDGGPVLTKALGAEEARKLGMRRATLVDSSQLLVLKYRPDLSYRMSPPTKTASVR